MNGFIQIEKWTTPLKIFLGAMVNIVSCNCAGNVSSV
jgi:hypothetical protein